MSYTATYYEEIREGCESSADVVVPLILDAYPAKSVVDVGCGEGHWGKVFEDAGCHVKGIDGEYAEPVIEHLVADLEQQLRLDEVADLAVCLEVAEHLSRSRASSFVFDLCRLAPVILFSAAVPGQGGEGHLNEQWPDYWAALFERQGHTCSAALRWDVWDDDRVDSWYRQNLMIATSRPELFPQWFDTPLADPLAVIHPAFFADLMSFIHNMAAQGKIEWR